MSGGTPAAEAEAGRIDIEVRFGQADIKAAARLNPDRPFWVATTILARVGGGALGAAAVGLVLIALDPPEDLSGHLRTATALLAGMIVGIFLHRLVIERIWRRRIRAGLSRHTLRVHSDGVDLVVDGPNTTTRMGLSGFERVVDTPSHLILIFDGSPLVLPKAAFPDIATAEAFGRFVRSKPAKSADKATP